MTKDCLTPGEKARKIESEVLRRLTASGASAQIARETGISDVWISGFKDNQSQQACLVLTHLGLKVVDDNETTVSKEKLTAFALLASDVFKNAESVTSALIGGSNE